MPSGDRGGWPPGGFPQPPPPGGLSILVTGIDMAWPMGFERGSAKSWVARKLYGAVYRRLLISQSCGEHVDLVQIFTQWPDPAGFYIQLG